ncbi:hypothetical protein ACFSQT_14305 [Mesorhizobium calcicola]|uniref:Uncharacterized protein n=1 Tax=Mesorhizobium calcicola TaxID=1300310 RepID=A0ABW4WDV8_9HYPH
MSDIETLTASILSAFKTTAQKTQLRAVPFSADEIVRRALADTSHRHEFLETVDVNGVSVSAYGIPTLSKKLLVFTAADGKAYSGFAPIRKPAAPKAPKKAAQPAEPKAKPSMPVVTSEPKDIEADERTGIRTRTHDGAHKLYTYVPQGAAVGDRVVSGSLTTRIIELSDITNRGQIVHLVEDQDFGRIIAVMSALAREPKRHDEPLDSITRTDDKMYVEAAPGTFAAGDRFTSKSLREYVVTGVGEPFRNTYSEKWLQYAYVAKADAYDAMDDAAKAALPKNAVEADALRTEKAKVTAKEERRAATVLGGKALTGTPKQRAWAETIRKDTLGKVSKETADKLLFGEKFQSAMFWIDNRYDLQSGCVGRFL